MGPPGTLVPRDPLVLQEETGNQERPARKAASVKRVPQDLREAREIPDPLALLGRTAWQEPLDQLDHQGPQDPLGPPGSLDQDSLQDLMTWKAPGDPSGRQCEAPRGRRDHPALLETREK